ncbi:MAG TPA: hypothetical protein VM123_05525 [archaeon]|nr:hypothetical protein [archaeon]
MSALGKFFIFLLFWTFSGQVQAQEPGLSPRRISLSLDGPEPPGGPYRLAVDSQGSLFVLDRGRALLYRLQPETGKVIWRIDGSESGRRFIDPAYISQPDGFFIYLTDRGSRLVWRIDYRGEIRGSLDLPFAADPVLLELAAGRQLVVYDRAGGLIHLLDDSGRPLWSFPAGGGRKTSEPADISVSADGSTLYLLWPEGLQITTVDIFGRTASTIQLNAEDFLPRRIAAVAGTRKTNILCLTGARGPVVSLDPLTQTAQKLPDGYELIWDIGSVPGKPDLLYLLVGPEAALIEIKLETGD